MQPISDLIRVPKVEYQATESPPPNGQPSPASTPHDLWLGFDTEWPPGEPARAKLRQAKRKVADWFNECFERGEALVLSGGYGCGKTHLARVVLGACAPHLSFFISEPDLVLNVRATYDGDGSEKLIIAQYRRAGLLILDDVGTAHVRRESLDWLQEIYWRIFDRRAEAGLPMLLTTNLPLAELGERIGGRALSRLSGMTPEGNMISLAGVPDYRMRLWRGEA